MFVQSGTKSRILVIIGLLLVTMSMGQLSPPPQLTFGNQLVALTQPSAFERRTDPVTVLRSNFGDETLRSIARGAQQFGLDLLQRFSVNVEKDNKEFMISPFSVWSLLILLYEGASGQTYNQLRQTLRINVEDEDLRGVWSMWSSYLNINTSTIEVASLQALYTDKLSPVTRAYQDVVRNYNVEAVPVDFYDRNTVQLINEATNHSTRGLIPYTVLPQEIYGAKIFMLSSLFFKGQWKFPFNESLTRIEPFYNENGEVVSRIPMMVQEANFAYAVNIEGLDGYVLELPYGTLDRLSMIIVLPKRGFKLNEITNNLKNLGLDPILGRLKQFRSNEFNDNEVEVMLPKFTTTTDVNLKDLLVHMGIRDLFDEKSSDLTRMASGLYTNLFVHSTKIIVDEKGTTAAAVTSAVLINKSTPPRFQLNRPFLYMIVEKKTSLLLFAGQVRNPKET